MRKASKFTCISKITYFLDVRAVVKTLVRSSYNDSLLSSWVISEVEHTYLSNPASVILGKISKATGQRVEEVGEGTETTLLDQGDAPHYSKPAAMLTYGPGLKSTGPDQYKQTSMAT